jgi:hypothetical protein
MCLSVSLANRLEFWVKRVPGTVFELRVDCDIRRAAYVAAKEQKAGVIGPSRFAWALRG